MSFRAVKVFAWGALCCAVATSASTGVGRAGDAELRVRAAALGVYVHGMTAEIADREVGRAGVGVLLRILDEPSFPRRDNVVAFLAYLGGPESTPALVRLLDRPGFGDASVEDGRALLLVPHALGRIAARGDRAALDALLALTAQHAVTPGSSSEACNAAIGGLALAGGAAARERLTAIADRRVVPDPKDPHLAERARSALESVAAPPERPADEPAPVDPALLFTADPASQTHAHGLTFINHLDVTSPMTVSRLDSLLQESTRRAARADYADDVACCTRVSRSGSAGTFGSHGDGLDSIDDSSELNSVLNRSAGRVKVVKVINYCGGPGTNIIGCSYSPGNGMAVVRLSNLVDEAILWIHEYGHNLGLSHSNDSRAIMFASDNGNNNVLSLAECSKFHSPSSQAQAMLTVAGSCTDDGDSFADPIDNCPLVANESQADGNGNGIGDACESCPGGAGDPDGDGICDPDDNCPTTRNTDQADFDGDGIGDACETGALRADINHSGRVDGIDLARLGRAFGSSTGGSRYDAAADLDRDGQVDGADLALLAAQFGK